MTLQVAASSVESAPHRGLAFGVLHEAVKSVKTCPNHVNQGDVRGKTRLKRALEVLEWADQQDYSFNFWCEVADILPEWMTIQIKEIAEGKPLLWRVWEGQNDRI